MSQISANWGIHFDQSELLCREGCGYYGNPAWQGYCSKCWREQNRKQQRQKKPHEWHQKTGTSQTSADGYTGYFFAKFEEKKSNEKWRRANTMKKFFSSTKSLLKTDIVPVFPLDPQTNPISKTGDFTDFLKSLQKPATQFIQKNCISFIETMQSKKGVPVQEQSDLVQDFYQGMTSHFQNYPTEESDRMMDNIEKMVMTQLYKSVFCPDNSQDEQKDLAIQRHIRSLHWVTPEMLHAPINEGKAEVRDDIFFAVTGLNLHAVQAHRGEDVIQVYKILSGLERCCAVAFIEKLDAPALSLTREEFDQHMQGQRLQVRRIPHCLLKSDWPGLQQIQQNQKLLLELRSRQDRIIRGVQNMQQELKDWPRSIGKEVQEIMNRFPLHIPLPKVQLPAASTVCSSEN